MGQLCEKCSNRGESDLVVEDVKGAWRSAALAGKATQWWKG